MDRPHRSFDPLRVGQLECETWVSYYRHEWLRFLRAALDLTRHTFGLPWRASVYGAWLVLRANMQWAPRDNDPVGARLTMERFYALVKHHYGEGYDPLKAAELEVEWWRVHRLHQHGHDGVGEKDLIDALASLYAYVYGADDGAVRRAAEQRALAMRYSDRWVREGCPRPSPLIGETRAALVRSYAALLSAVHVT
ncbi:MAG TPA: hypothetical protein VFN87_09180 [Solirubrobacteraceae bacterium]|nr:hypothetical protein [Solirubrobacteraceae bacterium]